MAIDSIKLQGKGWDLELCWAFSQGFYNAKSGANIDFSAVDQSAQQVLGSRKHIMEWVREVINLGPEALSPELLSEKTVDLIKGVLPQGVSLQHKIVSGEALLTDHRQGIYTVGKGDTLSDIARRNQVSLGVLRQANSLKNDVIWIGQKLVIPAG